MLFNYFSAWWMSFFVEMRSQCFTFSSHAGTICCVNLCSLEKYMHILWAGAWHHKAKPILAPSTWQLVKARSLWVQAAMVHGVPSTVLEGITADTSPRPQGTGGNFSLECIGSWCASLGCTSPSSHSHPTMEGRRDPGLVVLCNFKETQGLWPSAPWQHHKTSPPLL